MSPWCKATVATVLVIFATAFIVILKAHLGG